LIVSYVRTLILYSLLILVIRLMGKRQIGQMEASEFVVTMLVANLASIPMQDEGIPLFFGMIPILTVLGMELCLSALSLRSIRLRRLLCGKPVILIENGRILQENLRKTRVTIDELTGLLRLKDVMDLRSVRYAILETNGSLSVFPYAEEKPASAADAGIAVRQQYLPFTIVCDGCLIEENLRKAKKDTLWLQKVLQDHNAQLQETWLLTVDQTDRVVFYRKDI
jgi:uncharacterized membrane protein YcaP (DUF421 family)